MPGGATRSPVPNDLSTFDPLGFFRLDAGEQLAHATPASAGRQPPMRWHDLGPGHGVLELDFPIADRHPISRRKRGVPFGNLQFPRSLIRTAPEASKAEVRPALLASRPPALELELLVYWGGGEPPRAVWVWSQTGAIAWWAAVGVG